jgi:hypothetical protein
MNSFLYKPGGANDMEATETLENLLETSLKLRADNKVLTKQATFYRDKVYELETENEYLKLKLADEITLKHKAMNGGLKLEAN